MKFPKLLVLAIFLCVANAFVSFGQQITTDSNLSLESLIESRLGASCVEISNISSSINGQVNGLTSYGSFNKANSEFPFKDGVVLTTGRLASAGNTQILTTLNDGDDSWGTDPDLESALGITKTVNATSIEFDFVSVANLIEFNYILASEEYNANFPCQYSDGFAFLIRPASSSGPYQNIALIPGTSIPVNTNTIHDEIVGFCPAENNQYFEGNNLGDTNYNGRTTVLTASASITPNVKYHIKLVIADQDDKNYDSAVFIEGNSFNASVDLGPDIETCAQSVLLDGDIDNNLANYEWYRNGAIIEGATNPTYQATLSGTYRVEISIELGSSSCVITDEVVLGLDTDQGSTVINDMIACDDLSGDGVETFDLGSKESEVLSTVPSGNYVVSFHTSQSDADNNTNALPNSYQNTTSPEPIVARIADLDNGCLAFATFNLVVNNPPQINDPDPLTVCDDEGSDGVTTIDLDGVNDQITGGDPDLYVSYHFSELDANSGDNPAFSPYTNSNPNETLYVRVYNGNTGCYNTTTLDLSVIPNPPISSDRQWINACEEDLDGFAEFDLSSNIDDVLQGLPASDFDISYHESEDDAKNGVNAISNETNFQNTVAGLQVVWIRIVDKSTGCSSITPLELHANIVETGFNTSAYSVCDDASQDGVAGFDLNLIEEDLVNGYDDFTVIFYETEADQQNQTNALDKSVNFVVSNFSDIIYATIVAENCTETLPVGLTIDPAIELGPLGPVEYCDDDTDGFVSIFLETFDEALSQNVPNPQIDYFLTEDDARNNENLLLPYYVNTSNPQTLYARVTNSLTGCYEIGPFEVNIVTAPSVNTPSPLTVCEIDNDGIETVDLTQKNSEITSNPSSFIFSYYLSETDAIEQINPIDSPEAFDSYSQLIFVRIDSESTGCFNLTSFNVYINTEHNFPSISTYQNCEDDGSGITEFFLNTKDEEILNGEIDKEVLYFLSEADANNRTNPIDKLSAYRNTSNPQTVYARVEGENNPDCFAVAPFQLEVGSLPPFNDLDDKFVCDDSSNDGIETIDLSSTIDELTAGISEDLTITFHDDFDDAQDGVNALPLNYTNQFNPQQLYIRVDDGGFCPAIVPYTVSIIQVPQVNNLTDFEECDTDYDGQVTFDLTRVEVEVLDIRQNNIEVSYHASLEGAENDTQIISNPASYQNISNPQTVYIKVNNNISDCYVALPINLTVNLPPRVLDFNNYEICDNENNEFNLSEINTVVTDENLSQLNIYYYSSQADAISDQNRLPNLYNYSTNNDQIFVRLQNKATGCWTTYDFNLVVNPSPMANDTFDFLECDDDFDGFLEFDLSRQNSTILGNQSPFNFTVTYHASLNDANNSANPLETTYNARNNQIIYARVTNNSTGCFSTTTFKTIVNPRPIIDIPDQVLCIDNPPLVVSANTNVSGDSYEWSTGDNTPEIEIFNVGTYSVTITSIFGCESSQSFEVTASETASIDVTETVDFSDPNNITITISGIGNYLYVLDNGQPQESNVFENVKLGYHIIKIIDLNGCAEATKEVVVIDAPKFMTPNGDGFFDTWHIIGIETLPGSIVYIYDRYGKLLKTLLSTSPGWNGFYNGSLMPGTDYWWVADIKSPDGDFQVKGHFALKH